MARFINTGDQNKANMEDRRCNQKIFFYLKKECKKSLAPNKHFAGVSTKV